jgi:imidazolonepropionase-like amidohydrolase
MIGRRLRPVALSGAVLVLLLAPLSDLSAQHAEPPPAAAHALLGVTVVRPDGSQREGMTLVVRDGLLASVSADTAVPADARLLEGDSLFIYPGLVDAEGDARFEFAGSDDGDAGDDGGEVPGWNPPRDVQGFQPHRRAVDALTVTTGDLEGAREAGVVASASHPDGALAPGRGVLLLHRLEAEASRDLVLRPELGPVLAFDGARGYPGTLMGVIAFLRQGFADAGHRARLAAAHADDPAGMTAPGWDPDLEVLERAAAGQLPVYFRADRAEDIRRVLDLSEELGFRSVIVGGEEAWKVADRLREADVPVLVSLDFPTAQRWDPDEAAEAEEEPEGETPPDTAEGGEGDPDAPDGAPPGGEGGAAAADTAELAPEVAREKRRLEDAYANAGRLHDAGVRFALTSGGGDADLLEGARKAVAYGLPETAAVRALTAAPAGLLGVPWLTRVGQGQAATFIVADGPLLEEDTEILYTFVEGRLQRVAEPGEEPEEPPAADITGTWAMEVEGEMGSFEVDLDLEQEGASFEGTASGQFGTLDVDDGLVSGTDVSFTIVAEAGGETLELSFSGTVEDDTMSGSGSGPPEMGSFSWEASRTGGPGAGR